MQILNDSIRALTEMRDGITWAYPTLTAVPGTHGFIDSTFVDTTVPIFSGGGSGHDPAHWGYVGKGMLTGGIMGDFFMPPTAAEIVRVIRTATHQRRAFLIVKNFVQDVKEFTAAAKELRQDGWDIGTAIVRDDVSVTGPDHQQRRRGVAGTILVHKMVGAAAAQGTSVAGLKTLADKLLPELKTIGFSSSGAYIPGHENPSFNLPEDTISYGVGIHGEPGYHEETFRSSELLANELVDKLRINFHWQAGDHFAVLVNSLGGTTTMETLVFANDIRQLLALGNVQVDFVKAGNFLSANGMHGLSLSLLRLADAAWLPLLQAPVQTPSWPQQ